ncbi:MAG: MscL family protein [Gemmatimonadota bacterium]
MGVVQEFKEFALKGNVMDLADVPAGTVMTLDAVRKAGVPVFAYGNFLTVAINFLILAFIIFQMVKAMNKLKRSAPPPPPPTPEDVLVLREIRDALKARA